MQNGGRPLKALLDLVFEEKTLMVTFRNVHRAAFEEAQVLMSEVLAHAGKVAEATPAPGWRRAAPVDPDPKYISPPPLGAGMKAEDVPTSIQARLPCPDITRMHAGHTAAREFLRDKEILVQ